jgi:hypothetical protein
VCPPLDGRTSIGPPRLYRSTTAADRFLGSEVYTPPPEVRNARLEAAALAAAIRERANKAAAEGKLNKARDELHQLLQLDQPIRYRDLGWRRVPLCYLGEYEGPACNDNVREFLHPEVYPLVPLSLELEYQRAQEGWSGVWETHLAFDWPVDAIEADVDEWLKRWDWKPHTNVGAMLIEVTYRLFDAREKFIPGAPNASIADFCQSWWIHRYLYNFCDLLKRPEIVLRGAATASAVTEQLSTAKLFVFRRLAEFAYKLRNDSVPTLLGNARPVPPAAITECGREEVIRQIEVALNSGRRNDAMAVRAALDNCTKKNLYTEALACRRCKAITMKTAYDRWQSHSPRSPRWVDKLMTERLLQR